MLGSYVVCFLDILPREKGFYSHFITMEKPTKNNFLLIWSIVFRIRYILDSRIQKTE